MFFNKHGYDGTIEQIDSDPELVLMTRAPLYFLCRNCIIVAYEVLKELLRKNR